MHSRPLISAAAALAVAGGLLAAAPSLSAASSATPTTILDSTSGDLRAVVTAPVGGDWAVRFVDDSGTVLASVARDAIALETAEGRVVADRVTEVDGDTVELGTADDGLTASVTVAPDAAGVFAVRVAGHGAGITGVSIDLKAGSDERYLGFGERSNAVDQRGRQVQNRVEDGPYTANQAFLVRSFVPEPGLGERPDSTYFPVPWMLSTSGYGVLVDNDEDSSFELATSEHRNVNRLVVEADYLDLRVFGGPTPARALKRMSAAIGRQPAPSTPALYGAWFQPDGSNWNAEFDEQREQGVPVSVAETSVHYLPCGNDRGEVQEMARTKALHDRGMSATAYFNPMICTNFLPEYQQGIDANAFTRGADGSTLVYPYSTARHFEVSQVDFSSEAGREYFKGLLQEAVDHGYDGWMEDFGEYTPDDALYADGTPDSAMHNRYVEDYHATAREFEETAPRPLLRFQRSGWTDAVKESSIVWGGDPTTGWGFDGLTSSVTQGLNMGMSGVSVWGPDIGGFFTFPGDPQRSPELLNRWIEYGAFTGVMRLQNGGIQIAVPKPVKVDDPAVAPTWKRYTRLRTMLYPYVAGSQDAYQRKGLPLMRHLSLTNARDQKAVKRDDQYLFGQDLLVAPVTEEGARTKKTYLPTGTWIELARAWEFKDDGKFKLKRVQAVGGKRTVTAKAQLKTIPLFLRAGAVIPMLPRTVDTLSEYGKDVEGLVDLTDEDGRRILLAAPRAGSWSGPLGAGETMSSTVTKRAWKLEVDADQDRTYAVKATLAGMDKSWKPCRVVAGGEEISFSYFKGRRVLQFSAPVGAEGTVRVTACR
ncbi:MAG: TIM-barrel domain-containing protein [Nocardioides sp.]